MTADLWALFAAMLLAVVQLTLSSVLTLIARLLYVPAYAFGPVGLRPICWLAAQIGIFVIVADLFV